MTVVMTCAKTEGDSMNDEFRAMLADLVFNFDGIFSPNEEGGMIALSCIEWAKSNLKNVEGCYV